MDDVSHMRAALALARRGLGETWPNPSVGCVIVQPGAADGQVVGRGRTAPGGRPHAEAQALEMAGARARGATAYVTLEPCCHAGRGPACADALVAAGIARVVVAINDPDARMAGAGLARLRDAGIPVETGLLAEAATDIAAGFLCRVAQGRPLVTLKLATTLDGRIATRDGQSQWITGVPARRAAHFLRAEHDAILVGVGTVMTDDPALTCRLPGARSTPLVRVVADSHLRTSGRAQLVASAADIPTWFLHRDGADPSRIRALAGRGAKLLAVPGAEPGVDLAAGLTRLGAAGITRLLVEGGAQIAAALLRAGLVDHLAWFHAPSVMGGDGWPAAQAFGIRALAEMPRFARHAVTPLGDDMLSEYRRVA